MVKQGKPPNSTKKKGGAKATPKSPRPKTTRTRQATTGTSTPIQNTNQSPAVQTTTPQIEHQEITAAKISGRLTLFAGIMAAIITAIVTGIMNYPSYLLNLNSIHASQTASVVTQTSQAQIETIEPTVITTAPFETPTYTPTIEATSTLNPESLALNSFLDELVLTKERAIYENNWGILEKYYCDSQISVKLENFRLWIATLGTNASARQVEEKTIEISAFSEKEKKWKVVRIETWIYAGDSQKIFLKHVDKYVYFLDSLPTGTYCIADYVTEKISHSILGD